MANKSTLQAQPSPNPQVAASKKIEQIIKPLSWRGKEYPSTNVHTTMDQVLVTHEYPDKDGARIESLGRKPYTVSADIPFNNFISPDKIEKWKKGSLFPTAYFEFLKDCEDSSVGVLNHPFIGAMNVKCQKVDTKLESDARGGVVVSVSWIEHTDINLKSTSIDVGSLQNTSEQFYSELQKVNVLPANVIPNKADFFSLIDKVINYVDLVNLKGQQLLSPLNQLIYRLNRIISSINALNTNTLSNLKNLTIRLLGICINIVQTLSASSLNSLKFYSVGADCTMSDVAKILNVDIVMLLNLNPRLAKKTIILKGTKVAYE